MKAQEKLNALNVLRKEVKERLMAFSCQQSELTEKLKKVNSGIYDTQAKLLNEKLGIPYGEFYIKAKWHRQPTIYKIIKVSMTVNRYHTDMLTLIGHTVDSSPAQARSLININKHVSEYSNDFDICSKGSLPRGWIFVKRYASNKIQTLIK